MRIDVEHVSLVVKPMSKKNVSQGLIDSAIEKSWGKVAPFWPLKNLIATNPLSGFESYSFKTALKKMQVLFQQPDLPEKMHAVNRVSMKWLQAFFDDGQATISMPLREKGFFSSVLSLLPFDNELELTLRQRSWLAGLPKKAETVIAECLLYLGIPTNEYERFLLLQLTSLPGWAAYVQYRVNWADDADAGKHNFVTHAGYLAVRLGLTCLLWPQGRYLLAWNAQACAQVGLDKHYQVIYDSINQAEDRYRQRLLIQLAKHSEVERSGLQAQFVFCIDVRSEPFRRAIEMEGSYETFGFAGFFGMPIAVESDRGEKYASCPVLLKPSHVVREKIPTSHLRRKNYAVSAKSLYQSVKYNFATPFALAESIGLVSGVWAGFKSLLPSLARRVQRKFSSSHFDQSTCQVVSEDVSLEEKIAYATGMLKAIGLTQRFSPLVVLCGHGSATENNAYASSLDCGACSGRAGGPNAQVMAAIINEQAVRKGLKANGIFIPDDTIFLAAEHNTTTDAVIFYQQKMTTDQQQKRRVLIQMLELAKKTNNKARQQDFGENGEGQTVTQRSQDWAQVRPEWGLAKNAAFIVGPRSMTQSIDLEGRAFLHSYDWKKDEDCASLTAILTAPMVVAQWINSQYLFSTLDNAVFGGGDKVTANVTGKFGIVQGNGSDLMTGLPLQSVYKDDLQPYHEPMRLLTVVCAPCRYVESVVMNEAVLQKLFGNGWVTLVCLDPESNKQYLLQNTLTWQELN